MTVSIDERRRQETLSSFQIMDTPPCERFDRLARLAADVFGVSTAAISLIDANRQWFKSIVGLDLRQTPRSLAFCDHTIRQAEALVIPDAQKDPRFAGFDLVQHPPHIRFYAGVPLMVNESRIGTLCLMDTKPRDFNADEEVLLQRLGAIVVDELWLHRQALEIVEHNRCLAEANQRLDFISHHDMLTGLFNRRGFLQRLTEESDSGRPYGVCLLDLDDFKLLNDTSGHDTGDEILREIGRRLTEASERSMMVARIGGDEFGVIVSRLTQPWAIVPLAQRLLDLLSRPYGFEANEFVTSVSIGIAFAPQDGISPQEIVKAADLALHHAKTRGGNRFTFYAQSFERSLATRRDLFARARSALAAKKFVPYFQPLVRIRDRALCGFEALVRWDSAGGIIAPGRFLEALNDEILGTDISETMLERTIAQIAAWRQDGMKVPPISVNVTSGQLRNPNFVERLTRLLAKHGLGDQPLKIEITENVILGTEQEKLIAVLESLRKRGHQIALDDFGTGYASLSHLNQFPIDQLKIDMSFVQTLDASRNSRAIVRSVSHLAHELGLEVVCEGIEHQHDLNVVAALGCDVAQGYLFSEPMPAAAVPEFIRGWEGEAPSREAVVTDIAQQKLKISRRKL